MKGTLSEGVLPGLLRELYVGRKTGILYFLNGEDRLGVRVQQGAIVRADSNAQAGRLGDTLVRLGRLSQADFERASELALRDRKRLGVALIELGIMDQGGFEEAVAVHVREILSKVFSWNEGSYSFEDQDASAPVNEDVTLKLSTGELILEAARRIQDPDVVRYALGDLNRILGPSNDPLLRFQRVTLTPSDGYVLSRVDGTLSAREVIQLIPMVPDEIERSLFGLLCTGLIEYLPLPPREPAKAAPARPRAAIPTTTPSPQPAQAPTPPPAPSTPAVAAEAAPPAPPKAGAGLSEAAAARRQEVLEAYEGLAAKNHFEILGISKASNETQVKEAYFRLAKRFHPDAHHDPALVDLKDKLEAVFIRLGKAYEVLRNKRSRSSYESDLAARIPRFVAPAEPAAPDAPHVPDPAMEARAVEEALRKAEKRFVEEKYWDAIQLLEPAIPRAQGKQKSRGRVLLARAYLKNPNWVKRAEELLLRLVEEDPKCAEAHFVLGTIYKTGGLKSRAFHSFEKVLQLKPDHEEAAAEAAQLAPTEPEAEPEGGGGGLLKKLFGKS